VRSEAVVGSNRCTNFVRVLRPHAGIYILAPIAVRPPVERAFAHGGEIVGNQIGTDFVAFVHYCPELVRAGLDGQRGGIAQASGIGLVCSGLHVDLPYHRAVDVGCHAALRDVAVRTDSYVQEPATRARGQRLRPMMVDRRRQIRDFHRLPTRLCLAVLVLESHDRILVGDKDAAVDECETVRRIELVREYRLHFVDAVAVGVAQQRLSGNLQVSGDGTDRVALSQYPDTRRCEAKPCREARKHGSNDRHPEATGHGRPCVSGVHQSIEKAHDPCNQQYGGIDANARGTTGWTAQVNDREQQRDGGQDQPARDQPGREVAPLDFVRGCVRGIAQCRAQEQGTVPASNTA
jgi:hypothetical protein